MSKYRFAGTIKGIEMCKDLVFTLIPDSEYSSVFKKGKEETRYALIQPENEDGSGCVFKYEDTVKMKPSPTGVCAHFKLGIHCMLELDDAASSSIFEVTFTDLKAGKKKNTFAVTAVTIL